MRGRRRERLRVESRVHDTNLRSVREQNRCQVVPTILFECPAQIPRSFLRSFSLWARHSAETSAVFPYTTLFRSFFPVTSRQVRRLRKRRREGNARAARGTARVERGYVLKTVAEQVSRTAASWGPQFSSSAPPSSPAPSFDHFPFGPAILRRRVPSGTCAWVRRNFSLGPAGRCDGEEAAEGRNARAAQ